MIAAPVSLPISKRTRERAALLCALRASTVHRFCDLETLGLTWASQAHRLADAAVSVAWRSRYFDEACAEAEAMLRTGWTP